MSADTEAISRKKQKQQEKENHRRHPIISKNIIKEWEELRQKSGTAERKLHLCENIIKISKNVLLELIQQKTTARVYQSVIEFGNEEHRWTIFEIIKNNILDLCEGKYSVFAVIAVLKYGTKEQKLGVYSVIRDNISSLIRKQISAKVVEYAFNDFANSLQRTEMIHGLYGKVFLVTSDSSIKKTANLQDILSKFEYGSTVLNNIHQLLKPIIEKGMLDMTITQHLLYQYLSVLIKKSEKTNLQEILDLLKDKILSLCNTKEGSKVAMMIYWSCNSKERKSILSQAKQTIVDLCSNDNAYLLVMAILDQTDDVVQLNKNIIKPIIKELDVIMTTKSGRKVIQFLMNHRSPKFCDASLIALLKQGDNNTTSKKDSVKRAEEILDASKENLLEWASKNTESCLQYNYLLNVLVSIMIKCIPDESSDKMRLYNSILEDVAFSINEEVIPELPTLKRKRNMKIDCKVPVKKQKTSKVEAMDVDKTEEEDNSESHLLERLSGHFLAKELCALEKEGKINNFCQLVIKNVAPEVIHSFVGCNRTAFFLVQLYETGNVKMQEFLKNTLKPIQNIISKSSVTGAKVLSKHLIKD